MDVSRIEDLWSSLLAGETLTLAEENDLAAGLNGEDSLRERLLRDGELDAALRSLVRCQRTKYRFVGKVLERIESAETVARMPPSNRLPSANGDSHRLSDRRPPLANGGLLELDPEERPTAPPRVRRLPAFAAFAAAACVLIASTLICWWLLQPDALPVDALKPMVKQTPPRLEPLQRVARLVQTADCEWTGQTPEGRVAVGPVRLVRGKARFEFDDGASVELQGPAEFTLVSPSRGLLHRGSLRAVVPPQARGFQIETPNALITDLGTEFEVAVDNNGYTDVKVHKGIVEVRKRTPEGKMVDERLLGIGQSLRIESITPLQPAGGGFKESLIIDGELRDFTDRAEYEKVRRELVEKEKPKAVEPPEFVGPLERPVQAEKPIAEEPKPTVKKPKDFRGTIAINGKKREFTNLREFDVAWAEWRNIRDVLEAMALIRQGEFRTPMPGPGNFKAIIDINGEVHKFDNQADFEKFRQKMLKQFELK